MRRLIHYGCGFSLWLFAFLPGVVLAQTVEFTSSNLPIIVIDTHGETIPDEPKIPADMGIIDNGPGNRNYLTDPFNVYNGKIGIEVRGVSSQMFPKLQYGIETRDNLGNSVDSSLLGLPAESDWVLSAGYNDKSLLRNALAYHLSNSMGKYASRAKFFELVLNGDYHGVYVLFEKIKRTKNRVNVTKMKTTDVSGDNVTGGYIIKNDWENSPTDDGWSSPYLPWPGAYQIIRYVYEYPKAEDLVPAQKAYIESYVTAFEAAMSSTDYANPATGYPKYFDISSAVDVFLINEMSRNVDGYRLSSFMYKDRDSKGGKMKAGPVWDYDIAFGNVDYHLSYDPVGWSILTLPMVLAGENDKEIPYWWMKFARDSTFWNAVRTRWAALRANQFSLSQINGYIDSLATYLDEGQQRNFQRWPILSEYIWPNYYIGETYANEINYLKEWIARRIAWMDEALGYGLKPTAFITLQAGWNMVGLPGPVPPGTYQALYPTAEPRTLYRFNKTYIAADTMHIGIGYWIKLPAQTIPCTIPVTVLSDSLKSDTLLLNAGWNLIAGLSCPVAVSSIVDTGTIIIPGTFYSYSETYHATTAFEPGRAYWVKAQAAGMISMSCGSTPKVAPQVGFPLADLSAAPAFVISDASGATQRLFWNVKLPDPSTKESYSVPPLPAGDGFDARFVGDYRLTEACDAVIAIQSAHYPVTIALENVPSGNGYQIVELEGGREGERHVIANGSIIQIQNPMVKSLAVKKSGTVPVSFALEQNYPNPFNPQTGINFEIARTSEVRLVVYDVLGREVAVLVNEWKAPGSYSISFDARLPHGSPGGRGLASGVYFYRLTASAPSTVGEAQGSGQVFVETHKMILLQ